MNTNPEDIEIQLLLESIFLRYGYDFRNYGQAHAKRRILHRLALSGLETISALQHQLLHDEDFFSLFLEDLSINTTEMFRDPLFFKEIRDHLAPILHTYPFIKVWHAGCSTGEEVYSMAVLFKETALYKKTQFYATDFNSKVVALAKKGIYPVGQIKESTRNYLKAGGQNSFSDYYSAKYDAAIFNNGLKKNIVFSQHNLVTDSVFGEMNLVMCRNTLIYFNKKLQDHVIKLFHDSLVPGGFLCLGSKESIRFSAHEGLFDTISSKWKIYRKKY